MKKFTRNILSAILVLAAIGEAQAIVGYYNVKLYPGDNLVSDQLNNTFLGNSLNSVLSGPSVPDGTTFKRWNSSLNTFEPLAVYDSSLGGWWDASFSSPSTYLFDTFSSGRGAVISVPGGVGWTNTFVGEVVTYTNIIAELGGPVWQPNWADGLHLLGCPVPVGGTVSFMFEKITGRAPQDGESVTTLNPATQTYATSTYDAVSGFWDNSLSIAVGQAAWFNLGPVGVPEPSAAALLILSAAGGIWIRRQRTDS